MFIEVTNKYNANDKYAVNIKSIKWVSSAGDGTFIQLNSDKSYLAVRESYGEIKRMLGFVVKGDNE